MYTNNQQTFYYIIQLFNWQLKTDYEKKKELYKWISKSMNELKKLSLDESVH